MHLPRRRLSALFGLLLTGGAACAGLAVMGEASGAKGEDASAATYDLYFGGLPAGQAQIALVRGDDGYRATATGKTSGFIAAIVGGRFTATAEGQDAARPRRFDAEGSFAGDGLKLSILFGPETVEKVTADPPYTPKTYQIDPTEQAGVTDPLTAIALLLRERADGGLCDVSQDVFDGRRRFRVSLGAPEATEDGSQRCQAVIERVAGFKDKDLRKPPIRFGAFFTRDAGGEAQLSKIVAPTDYGVATAVRREG